MIAMWLAVLALVTARAEATPLAIAVVASRDVPGSLVDQICAEAEAIWEPAGIALECKGDALKHDPPRLTIEVTIDDRPGPTNGGPVLGWIVFTPDGPERLIHLSRASAEDLLRGTNLIDLPMASHTALIGRALGRALAHELGHYFLRSKVHTRRGLMRPVWPAGEAFAVPRRGFELTAEEQAIALSDLHAELAGCRSWTEVASCR